MEAGDPGPNMAKAKLTALSAEVFGAVVNVLGHPQVDE